MLQVAGEQAFLARQEVVIALLAVAGDEAGKDAGDAQRVQRTDNGQPLPEIRFGLAGLLQIGADGRVAGGWRHLAAGILHQHRHVPGVPADDGVLKVQEADPGAAFAFGQPDEVFSMIVAQGQLTREGAGHVDQRVTLAFPAAARGI